MKFNWSHGGDPRVTGSGMDAILGKFKVEGTVKASSPYSCALVINYVNSPDAHNLTGWREASEGGLFGEWQGVQGSGNWALNPVKDPVAANKILDQLGSSSAANLQTLMELGFSRDICCRALNETDDNVEEAVEWLSSHSSEDSSAPTPYDAPELSIAEPTPENITQLMELGFSSEMARNALALNGNHVERAAEFLFKQL
ncbi:hypothetical protein Pelo_7326 [Pelomyxa schiedti]|nr:hypothetical protein Pelo_7326 [Pelomyxa schiedti]